MRQFNAKILENLPLSGNYFELTIEWPKENIAPLPGQFLSLKDESNGGVLLKRPFAVSSFKDNRASVIIQVRGPATRCFRNMPAGTEICVTGPLGTPFPMPENGKEVLLVGGGTGLGPVLFLYEQLKKKNLNAKIILGFRGKEYAPELGETLAREINFCSDDGSMGFQGTSVDFIKTLNLADSTTIYACGPNPMLKSCEAIAAENSCALWISMEQTMACGIGACMGCVVETRDPDKPFLRVCVEGPVFPGGYIKWT